MFVPMRSFGSTIGLPFLSQTEDKQLSFRAGKNGIKRLYGSEVRATRDTILPYAKRDPSFCHPNAGDTVDRLWLLVAGAWIRHHKYHPASLAR
jgi:hypothetical protein